MKTAVKDICTLLESVIDIPVFDYTLPEGYSSACAVVREVDFDEEKAEGNYHINLYAPNAERSVGGTVDNSYPDMDTLAGYADAVLAQCMDFTREGYNGWITGRTLVKEGAMHYLNIVLIIQFN